MKASAAAKMDPNRERYEERTEKVRELLGRWHSASIDIVIELRSIELEGCWTALGRGRFEQYLEDEFPNAIGIQRYRHIVSALEVWGEPLVRKVGGDACAIMTAAPLIENKSARKGLVDRIEVHVEQHGVAPDAEKIRKYVYELVPELRPKSVETRELERNREARQRIAELEAELRKAYDKVNKLEATVRKQADIIRQQGQEIKDLKRRSKKELN